ncbi:MAG: L,D-transpeptidase scaffold domain-containing protein [Mucilaginibacter sp.]
MKRALTFLLLLIALAAKATEVDVLRAQLAAHKKALYYPKSVERFYRKAGFRLAWVAPDTVKTHTWDAMLLLDCVVQYGLNQKNYHAKELSYDRLHLVMEQPDKVTASQKALCDIFLTDAMICLINNLHYGRLNPEWSAKRIDQNRAAGFHAGNILSDALNKGDFKSSIIGVQPKSAAYRALQYQMYLAAGLHTGDCYETPESQVRLMAVNMERLRWVNSNIKTFIQINIPSNTLSFFAGDTAYHYKITGKSAGGEMHDQYLDRFTINRDRIILNPTADNSLTTPEEGKPLANNSYVRIPRAVQLAARLLRKDAGSLRYGTYKLQSPIPLRITYYTCEIKDGVLVTYKDINLLDKYLATALYR